MPKTPPPEPETAAPEPTPFDPPPCIRVVDFETTGAPDDGDPEPHAIVEVGWCDVVKGIAKNESLSYLVNPKRPITIPAMAVHHITDEDAATGESTANALRMLFVEGGPVDMFCAHNAAFERHFFEIPGVPWLCTYKIALRLWPDAPTHSNNGLRYFLHLQIMDRDYANGTHRAGPDAYVTARLLERILQTAREREIPFATLEAWSRFPPLFHKVSFGKHRGMLWSELPPDYLRWIADKSDMDADTKANARYRLREREAGQQQKENA